MNISDLYQTLWSFARHRVVTVAASTGILSRLAREPGAPESVAEELGLDPQATGKVIRALTALGVLELEGVGYAVVPELKPWLSPGEQDFTGFIRHAQHLSENWGEFLEQWVHTGQSPRRVRTTEQLRAFADGMRGGARYLGPLVIEALDRMQGVHRVLDVGGSVGVYAREFCRANPEVVVTVLDILPVVELGRAEVASEGMADRISFIPGDFHQVDWGDGYDLVLMSGILHSHRPGEAADLVQRGSKVLNPGGRLAVVDFIIDDDRHRNLLGCLFAINMRSFGDTYTEPTIRAWMQAAGLNRVRRIDLEGTHWLIVGQLGTGG